MIHPVLHTSLPHIFKSEEVPAGCEGGGRVFHSKCFRTDAATTLGDNERDWNGICMELSYFVKSRFHNLEVLNIKTLIIQEQLAWICLIFKPLLEVGFFFMIL